MMGSNFLITENSMKQKIERLKKLHSHLVDTLEMFSQEIAGIEEDYNGIQRRANPKVLTTGNTTPRPLMLTDTEYREKKRVAQQIADKKKNKKLTPGYLKQMIVQSYKGTITKEQVTPEMMEARKQQILLKRGMREQQEITLEKLKGEWE